jgi:uroporphyrin-III C-methyltransferase
MKHFTLIGAGPGDPDLISIKGAKALADADVVLYDALVHPDLLNYAKTKAEKIFVGKRAAKHAYSQDEINQLIVKFALEDKHVVRLKGGDPFIFGRGQEELDYASAFDIPTTSILGISSINLPGYYGIPLTKRGINESFWAVTATTSSGKLASDVALAAQSTATVIFFMGLNKLAEIVETYKELGREELPVAIISKGSFEEGQVFFGTIETIVSVNSKNKIPAPAIIVVGEVVAENAEFHARINRELAKVHYQPITYSNGTRY